MKPSGKIDLVSLIASISEILLEKDNFDEAVNTVLQMLGEWFQVDRVYLFTNRQESDNICIDYSFEWCAEGIEAFLGAPELTGVTWDSMPDVYLEMANGNVMFGNVADHPSDSFRELMTMQSIKSYHFFPIIVKSNFFGFVGFDNCKEERDWNLVESQALKSLGNLIAHRFLRDKEYNELQVKKRKEDKITYLLGSFQDLNESLSTNRISNRNHLRILEIAVSLAECDLGFYANKISTSKNEFKVTETLLNTPRLNEKDSRNITINTKDISLLNSKTIRVNHQNGVILIPDLAMEMVLISNDGKAKDFVVSNMVGIPLNHNSSDGDYIVLLNAGHLACSFDLELINRFKTLSEGFLNAFQVNLQKIIAEEELKKSEYLFRLLSENSNDLICLHDANGKFEYISPSMKDILGYDQSEFLGRLPIDLAHPDSIPEMVKQFNLFKDDSVVIPMITNRFLTKQGKAIYLQSSFRKILGHQSQPYKYISTSRDVTHDVILQESLRRSEQHFRLISENASDIVALHSYNLEFIWVSPSIEKLMGYKPEDVIGKTPDEVFHTIHYNEIYSYSKGSKGLVEVCHKTKFGNEIWLEISLTEFIDVDLNFEGLLALSRDVTERKRYQLKLESQRAAFERLFEESLGGYWDYFPQTNEEYLSPGFKRILGYEDHELENKPESWQKLIYSEDLEKLNQSLDNHIKSLGKLSFVEEARYKHKLGHELVVLCAGQVIEWDSNMNPVRIIGCHIDLTYLKAIERQLKQNEATLETILEQLKKAVWTRSADDSEIFYLNEAFQNMFGISREQMMKNPLAWVDKVKNEDKEFVKAKITRTESVHDGKFDFECRLKVKGTGVKWIRVRSFPIVRDGRIILRVSIAEDITDTKEKEINIKSLLEQEKELNEMKSYFISMVSHQFRTPMAIILTNNELIQMATKALPPEQSTKIEKYTGRVVGEVKRLTKLLTDILVIEKTRVGKLSYNPTNLNVHPILVEILEDFNLQFPQMQGHLVVNGDTNISLEGDLAYFRHAFINLIGNAFKYTAEGDPGPVITVSSTKSLLSISIKDYGMGVAEQDLGRLFKPFARGTNAGSIPGTGLGLVIAKEFIETMNGNISIQPSLPKGTEVLVGFKLI